MPASEFTTFIWCPSRGLEPGVLMPVFSGIQTRKSAPQKRGSAVIKVNVWVWKPCLFHEGLILGVLSLEKKECRVWGSPSHVERETDPWGLLFL